MEKLCYDLFEKIAYLMDSLSLLSLSITSKSNRQMFLYFFSKNENYIKKNFSVHGLCKNLSKFPEIPRNICTLFVHQSRFLHSIVKENALVYDLLVTLSDKSGTLSVSIHACEFISAILKNCNSDNNLQFCKNCVQLFCQIVIKFASNFGEFGEIIELLFTSIQTCLCEASLKLSPESTMDIIGILIRFDRFHWIKLFLSRCSLVTTTTIKLLDMMVLRVFHTALFPGTIINLIQPLRSCII
jgi:hypothetical protein